MKTHRQQAKLPIIAAIAITFVSTQAFAKTVKCHGSISEGPGVENQTVSVPEARALEVTLEEKGSSRVNVLGSEKLELRVGRGHAAQDEIVIDAVEHRGQDGDKTIASATGKGEASLSLSSHDGSELMLRCRMSRR